MEKVICDNEYFNGVLSIKKFYTENKQLHREDGPALIVYGKGGKITYKEWYLYDQEYRTKEEYEIALMELSKERLIKEMVGIK